MATRPWCFLCFFSSFLSYYFVSLLLPSSLFFLTNSSSVPSSLTFFSWLYIYIFSLLRQTQRREPTRPKFTKFPVQTCLVNKPLLVPTPADSPRKLPSRLTFFPILFHHFLLRATWFLPQTSQGRREVSLSPSGPLQIPEQSHLSSWSSSISINLLALPSPPSRLPASRFQVCPLSCPRPYRGPFALPSHWPFSLLFSGLLIMICSGSDHLLAPSCFPLPLPFLSLFFQPLTLLSFRSLTSVLFLTPPSFIYHSSLFFILFCCRSSCRHWLSFACVLCLLSLPQTRSSFLPLTRLHPSLPILYCFGCSFPFLLLWFSFFPFCFSLLCSLSFPSPTYLFPSLAPLCPSSPHILYCCPYLLILLFCVLSLLRPFILSSPPSLLTIFFLLCLLIYLVLL